MKRYLPKSVTSCYNMSKLWVWVSSNFYIAIAGEINPQEVGQGTAPVPSLFPATCSSHLVSIPVSSSGSSCPSSLPVQISPASLWSARVNRHCSILATPGEPLGTTRDPPARGRWPAAAIPKTCSVFYPSHPKSHSTNSPSLCFCLLSLLL